MEPQSGLGNASSAEITGNAERTRARWGVVAQITVVASKKTHLESAIPAKALYQARKAASRPKTPPALLRLVAVLVAPSSLAKAALARHRKARSSVKNREKNMTVERSVKSSIMVVKINQPMR